jgi:predicted transcriptional regulator
MPSPLAVEKPHAATVTLKLDASHRERLKSLASAKKRTAHYLMKEAIERYLTAEEAQQAVLSSVDESVADFEATGLHITLAQTKAWAKKLKANRSAQLSACRA